MPRDLYGTFSDAQDISGNAGTNEDSTNVIDLDQALGKDWKGTARTPDPAAALGEIEVVVTTALVAAADSTVLTVALYEHTAASSISSGNLISSFTYSIPAAGVAAGTVLGKIRIPTDKITERYIALNYARATQNLSSGAVDAALLLGTQKLCP